ncbi:MAG: Prefoldin subunit-domain-containing protein [Linnemannia gamsii]|nr:MAG: Prefoldin subunit-domain-containing protein [Linnemannia gamsii]
MDNEIQQKLARYESFVNEGLRKDLKDTLDARDTIFDQISEYLKLAKDIEVIKDNGLKEMKTQVDLGSNFYVQAKISDTKHIFVNVGFGFHAELTLDEALEFIKKKEVHLQKKAALFTEKASQIRAHIKLVLEAMAEIMKLDRTPGPRSFNV